MSVSSFKAQANNPKLIAAVVKQLGGIQSFEESAPDIANYGIDGGFHGFVYYKDTVSFWRKNKDPITQELKEMADSLGENPLDMIKGFGCLNADYSVDDIGQALYGRYNSDLDIIYNAFAWFAAEEVARQYVDFEGNN